MTLTERKAALEEVVQTTTRHIGQLTERLIGARAQLALLAELDAEAVPPPVPTAPNGHGMLAHLNDLADQY